MNTLLNALRALTTYDLEQLAGPTIVRAVKGAYETNRERALAQLVIDRFGTNLLKNKEIRCAFIDVLGESLAMDACQKLGLTVSDRSPQAVLIARYSGAFNQARAEEFVNVFGLSDIQFAGVYSPNTKGIVFGVPQKDAKEFSWRQIDISAKEVAQKGNPKLEIIESFMWEECKKLFDL